MTDTLEKKSNVRDFNIDEIRRDFPILHQDVNGQPLVYLDNAATTQKPQQVIDTITDYYTRYNSNVHRGAHFLSDLATQKFEDARKTIADFINSPSSDTIVWTRGTTESINLVAATWANANIQAGDRILVPELEHHSNIVPWQMLAEQKNAELCPLPVNEKGEIDLEVFETLLNDRTKLVAVNHVSNALGTINPVKDIIAKAHAVGAKVLVDGAQAVAHFPVDVQVLDCDFYAFSGHKIYGPTGIGVLWGKESILNEMPPYHFGGEMIETVSFAGTTFNRLPYKFEAGTPNICGAIALASAIDYVNAFDRSVVEAHESEILAYAVKKAESFPGLKRIGCAENSTGVLSFIIEGSHPADVGMLLDQQGVAVRTGHHCTQPLMERFNIPGTVRASFSMYNTKQDVDRLFEALHKVMQFLV